MVYGNHKECFISFTQGKIKNRQIKPISVNDRVISAFREDFMHMRSFVKIKPSRKFPNLQYKMMVNSAHFVKSFKCIFKYFVRHIEDVYEEVWRQKLYY